jgi:FHS family L-fucose permease-like MFS transporter
VQLAYFGAYFLLAIPASLINAKFGYKAGLLTGLVLASVGAFAFFPASHIQTYEAFLIALFAIAAGCSILETSANPYVISLGPEETATRRLNFAQAFNPVGTNIGVLLAATLILPKLEDQVDLTSLDPAQAQAVRAGQLGAVMGPYLGLGLLLLALAIMIAIQKAPPIVEEFPDAGEAKAGHVVRTLLHNKRYVLGVVAQFFNVAGQTCTWTYLIKYSQQAIGASLALGGVLLQIALIIFLCARFINTWIIGRVRPTKMLTILGCAAVFLALVAVVSPNIVGLVAAIVISYCLSLMFPTIYGVALKGLGPATKFGAAGLVMAIVGGAVMPLVQGLLLDRTSPAVSFLVPAFCFAAVTAYAIFDLRAPAPSSAHPSTASDQTQEATS